MTAGSTEMKTAGTLYVVATPIGNLADLTARAREVLAQVDMIAAEDTRHTGRLLQSFGIETRTLSLHEHNEADRAAELVAHLRAGKSIALVSDAGTPAISDPGYRLVREVANAGFTITPIPGACAVIAALSASALASDRFTFEGFLPTKASARRERLTALLTDPRTLIFYEAPHRLIESLEDLHAIFGADRQAVIARELTKAFETFYRGTLGELLAQAQKDSDMQRGEIVLLIAGAQLVAADDEAALKRALEVLLPHLSVSQAADAAAELTGAKRNRAYKLALQLKEQL